MSDGVVDLSKEEKVISSALEVEAGYLISDPLSLDTLSFLLFRLALVIVSHALSMMKRTNGYTADPEERTEQISSTRSEET
jgi:hypothetical protein